MPAKLLIIFTIASSFIAPSSIAYDHQQQKTMALKTVYQCDDGYGFYTATITHDKKNTVTLERPQGNALLRYRPSPSGKEYTNGEVLWWAYKDWGFVKSNKTPIIAICVISDGHTSP